ncbi:hypothetical protein [Algibacillus agarilyticus]|uniref:HzsA-related protein n=1 Tax=Algibacillus agarilyticus TaxID=2234133 RepID=UPI000DD0E895|nr:hypothetical protein [Algibacillus agarilyticus]
MIPNLRCIGVLLFSCLLLSCGTGSSINDEKKDPVLVEFPVVYIERQLITNPDREEGDDVERVTFSARNPFIFNPGARLVLQANAFSESQKVDLTSNLFDEGARIDIRDLVVSPKGDEFLVALHAPLDPELDDDEQPKWNIWRYKHLDKSFAPIINNEQVAGLGHDLMPGYLPDGRIIFVSTRQRTSRAILLDEGKPQYTALDERMSFSALNLHVMDDDGSNIKQLTFNLSHDFYPLVLQSGEILYSRWDTMGGHNKINLYKMQPDGTDNHFVYGWHSHSVTFDNEDQNIEYIKPQQLPDGKILLLVNSSNENALQKRPVIINIDDFNESQRQIDGTDLTDTTTNALSDFALLNLPIFDFSNAIAAQGKIASIFPLEDGSDRLLVSWALCRATVADVNYVCGQLTAEQLAAESTTLSEPIYELWIFSQTSGTQQKVASPESGHVISQAIVLQPSLTPPAFIPNKVVGNELDANLANEQAAAIHIRSVYDFDGIDSTSQGIHALKDPLQTSADELSARFLRVVRGVPMPPRDVKRVRGTDFGRSSGQRMREILGYVPIQPDGSVKFKVPANIPIALSVLNAQGERIGGRHRQWISLLPGEHLECAGCHNQNSHSPHGRLDSNVPTINIGALSDGVAFPNTADSILPAFGQTMAEADASVNGLKELNKDLHYVDIWTDPAISTPNADINLSYDNLLTLPPNGSSCYIQWNAYCRIQINYAEHIQPIFSLSRKISDEITGEVLEDNTCTACHSTIDETGAAIPPAAQLDLTNAPSPEQPAHLIGYRELFFTDLEQEVIDGLLVDRLIEVVDANGDPVFELDEEGELILDEFEQPIPVLTTVRVNNILRTGGANSSRAFFDLFSATGSHVNRLSADELRLIAEWLDIGAQYYNTPFYLTD